MTTSTHRTPDRALGDAERPFVLKKVPIQASCIGPRTHVDHFAAARVGVGAHACSLAGAVLLMLNPTPVSAAFALGRIGVGYGSGLAAGAIAQYWHTRTSSAPIPAADLNAPR